MQVQHRINMPKGGWRPCKDVDLRDGVLYCLLEPARQYVLTEAYENNLHIHFANANTDRELIAFLRGWGPLYIPNGQIPPNGVVALRLDLCRAYQRWIKALLDLLTAFKRAEGEREALEEAVQAEQRGWFNDGEESPTFFLLKNALHITGNVLDWAKGASLGEVRAATDYLIEGAIGFLGGNVKLICRRKGEQRRLEAGWEFSDLQATLVWMIWYDEFTGHPIICCQECRKVFRGETAHKRKFCTGSNCGGRKTSREWHRKKRATKI